MITIVFFLFLIVGFMIVDSVIDYLFIAIYALVATAIINNLVHMHKYYKKHEKTNRYDLSNSFWFLLLGVGAAIVHTVCL